MKISTGHILFPLILILAAIIIFAIRGIPYFLQPPSFEQGGTPYGSQTVRARVMEILEDGEITLATNPQPYQVLLVELVEGEYEGILIEVDYGKRQVRNDDYSFSPGDEMFVQLGRDLNGILTAYYVDYVRTKPLLLLLGIFITATILLGRWKGVGSLLALAFTMVVIVGYIVPHILAGEDPLRVSLIGSTIMLGSTLYLTYGWNMKTHASFLSVVLALLLTGILSIIFVSLTRLTGSGDESSLFLVQFSTVTINLRGLLLGGMLIGALGVLDDLVSSQSAAVFELNAANPSLTFQQVFERSMRIGRDHVAATVNTLVLAYTGASLPLLLLFTLGSGNYGVLLNAGFIAEEIVRMLVGSLGLIAAVPITSVMATAFALNSERLRKWQIFRGARLDNGEGRHSH